MSDSEQKAGAIRRMVRFFLWSCCIGLLGGGLIGAAFALIGSMINPDGFRLGGQSDVSGIAGLFFLSWGFAGSILGAIVGVIGAIIVTFQR